MPSVWGFGTSAVDIRLKTAEYGVGYKDKLLAQESRMIGGGSTSNFLVQVSRLGFRAGWLGKLGEDLIGAKILDMLRAEGVDCSEVIYSPEVLSPFNVAVYAGDGLRRIGGFLLPNSMAQISPEEADRLANAVMPRDFVLLEVGEIPLDLCIRFGDRVKSKGGNIMIDVDLDPVKQCRADRGTADALFDLADYLMPNITSLRTLYPEADELDITTLLAEKHNCVTVTTLGANGAAFSDHGRCAEIVPAVPVTPVDTVGAGDAFHGGFAAGLCAGLSLWEAVRLGNVCGSHECRTFGIRDGMIRASELESYGIRL